MDGKGRVSRHDLSMMQDKVCILGQEVAGYDEDADNDGNEYSHANDRVMD